MQNKSIPLDTSCEFIKITPINPLISRCEIKVCYVSDEPNRNHSVITKEVATQMANSLPGSPIVGYYNEELKDFEDHNFLEVKNGQIIFKDETKPYGFVDLNAKVWFQKFLDNDEVEREYLVTEGYLWTGQFPECKRILEKGNNQSMELSKEFSSGFWSKDNNSGTKFFIINEAIISKLCILGEDVEPCFEGATITKPVLQFSYDEGFKTTLLNMMKELKELLTEGEKTPMITAYAVEIGGSLWDRIYSYLEDKYPVDKGDYVCSQYRIDSIWEEDSQKFVILVEKDTGKTFRANFTYTENEFEVSEELVEVEKTYVPINQNEEAINSYEATRYNLNEEVIEEPEEILPTEEPIEDAPSNDPVEEPVTYNLEEIPEYVQLAQDFVTLKGEHESLNTKYSLLQQECEELKAFKLEVEKKDKLALINEFYMLSEEDKKDVIDNIDSYSLDDIEAKLAIICVRNRVSFDDPNKGPKEVSTVYSLTQEEDIDDTPAWIKSLQNTAKEINF